MNDISELRTHIVALARRLRQSARTGTEAWTGLMALGVIERAEDRATPTLVASELDLRSSNAAQILNTLEQRGLIERLPDPADKRRVRLTLTRPGRDLVRDTRAERDQWLEGAIQECLTEEERAQLIAAGKLMQRLALSPTLKTAPVKEA